MNSFDLTRIIIERLSYYRDYEYKDQPIEAWEAGKNPYIINVRQKNGSLYQIIIKGQFDNNVKIEGRKV